jgi:outer membrane protein OmpA-like peptidoglycan-associated protein
LKTLTKAVLTGFVTAFIAAGPAQADLDHHDFGWHTHDDNVKNHSLHHGGGHHGWHGGHHGGHHGDNFETGENPPAHHVWHHKGEDIDSDGVINDIDHCNATPSGSKVDAQGCSVVDTDRDTVMDTRDHCPNTNPLATVNASGCALDSDVDSVPDHKDQCANTAAGTYVDKTGCAADKDMDGIINSMDKCQNTFIGARVDINGCSKAPLAQLSYNSSKSGLDSSSQSKLTMIAEQMKSSLGMRIDIQGHTDWQQGDKREKNVALSNRRANTVKNFLVALGVDADRMVTTGFGDSRPNYYNYLSGGQSRNRRVEVHIIRDLHSSFDGATDRKYDSIR